MASRRAIQVNGDGLSRPLDQAEQQLPAKTHCLRGDYAASEANSNRTARQLIPNYRPNLVL
jgi:hypothetical protein